MEKTFRRLHSKRARVAFVESELVNGLSHQIRILRQQRGWTQAQLSKRLGTTQGVVSRLEDASYGRYSIKTLLQLASTFDAGLLVRFLPFSQFVPFTWNTNPERFEASAFEQEIGNIRFVDVSEYSGGFVAAIDGTSLVTATQYNVSANISLDFSAMKVPTLHSSNFFAAFRQTPALTSQQVLEHKKGSER